ncbi:hypothetical protein J7337_000669 [Fusarium musae]|uniref:Uncharacterized protein n=1 Tax=Fusarium musae TaxID=1042133 RepID=A0A9P8DSD7_9HYPO|nr:hypothetical protein J7337_000669 [Fusarium musae]KAG9507120.1 hypothetical protein J7337_000669 [Fusarium musae]
MSAEVSHGRGGAGNFKPDDTEYVDGEVVRTGVVGSHGDGAYSSGRGGKSFLALYHFRNVLMLHLHNNTRSAVTELRQVANTTSSGAGNIADIGTPATERKDVDIIPETAVRPSQDGRDYHTGRGGAGNAQTAGSEKESEEHEKPAFKTPVGLADKLKSKIFGNKK